MLTLARLKTVLKYNKRTGEFTWRVTLSSRAIKGAVAGTSDPRGYRAIRVDGKRYWAHRLAWFYVKGVWPTSLIDHRNMQKGRNRFSNLRETTHSTNKANRLAQANNTSGAKGVYWNSRHERWYAQIHSMGATEYLGCFENKADAATAYAVAAKRYFGEFARS